MLNKIYVNAIIIAAAAVITTAAFAERFDIPGGDLATALSTFTTQSGVALIVSGEAVKGSRTKGVRGTLSADDALSHILSGTGFITRRDSSGAVAIVRDERATGELSSIHEAAAATPAASGAALETVTVTSSKLGGDVQNIPISIILYTIRMPVASIVPERLSFPMSMGSRACRSVSPTPKSVSVTAATFSSARWTPARIYGKPKLSASSVCSPALALASEDKARAMAALVFSELGYEIFS